MWYWNQIVEVIRESIFAYAQASNGNLASGILVVTFLSRLALFPLTVWLAKSTAVQQGTMRRLQPELEKLRVKFKDDPARLARETQALLRGEGVSMIPISGCIAGIIQMPPLLALFDAVRQCASIGGRFLWIRDISKPSMGVAVLVGIITAASMAVSPQPEMSGQQRQLMWLLPAMFTVLALWKMAAGIGLYWGVSSTVGLVQSIVVRRMIAHRPV